MAKKPRWGQEPVRDPEVPRSADPLLSAPGGARDHWVRALILANQGARRAFKGTFSGMASTALRDRAPVRTPAARHRR
jgi:hypothetical protein